MPHAALASAFAASLLVLSSLAQAAPFIIRGSTTVANAIITPHRAEIEQESGLTLDVIANGSGRGLSDLAHGKADMAMISAPLETEVAASNAMTPGKLDSGKLVAHQIGEARIAFVVHPSNPVTTLTLLQVTGILAGKIINWSEVGGRDQAIIVIVATQGDGVRAGVESRLLAGASVAALVRELPNAPMIIQVVSQLPAAFGVVSSEHVRPNVTAIKTDQPIVQPLLLVTMGPASPDAIKIIDSARRAAK